MLELVFSVGFLDGIQKSWYVLPETAQAIGPAALQCLQVPFLGVDGPRHQVVLSPDGGETSLDRLDPS